VRVTDHGVTSLARLGITASMAEIDHRPARHLDEVFGEAQLARRKPSSRTDDRLAGS